MKNVKYTKQVTGLSCFKEVAMKYIAYCMLHKCWFTKDTIKPKCQYLDKKKRKYKKKYPKAKCQHLIYIEKEVKRNGNSGSNRTNS